MHHCSQVHRRSHAFLSAVLVGYRLLGDTADRVIAPDASAEWRRWDIEAIEHVSQLRLDVLTLDEGAGGQRPAAEQPTVLGEENTVVCRGLGQQLVVRRVVPVRNVYSHQA